MNEVRDVCARMLDGPEPPMRPADDVLAVARRAKRRHTWFTAAGAGGGVLAMVLLVAVLLGPSMVGRALTGWQRPPASAAAARYPVAQAAAAHGLQMADVLRAAVPTGVRSSVEEPFSHDSTVHPDGSAPRGGLQLLAGAIVHVYSGAGEGKLFAYLVHDGRDVPTGDLCGGSLSCVVTTVDGVAVRVVVSQDQMRGQVVEATRFLTGGQLTVASWQGVAGRPAYTDLVRPIGGSGRPVTWRSPLAVPLLSPDEVAALAADSRMLQFP